jgi:hypothetical protein
MHLHLWSRLGIQGVTYVRGGQWLDQLPPKISSLRSTHFVRFGIDSTTRDSVVRQ